MSEENDQNEEPDYTFVTEDEFSALCELFAKADVEADIQGDSLVLLAFVDDSIRTRFARVRLLPLMRFVGDQLQQQGRQEELLALMGMLSKMQTILSEYINADDDSGALEMTNDADFLNEVDKYRNPF